ncbi:hypothetical protein ACFFON_08720 [Arthrobacter citreus]|uniref:hypothetical protein n=1 Tax=Arthrobacter TaxID=1663 RepID=UPI0012649C23|nr:hypothetical protein [Arthrobacter gandavensis]
MKYLDKGLSYARRDTDVVILICAAIFFALGGFLGLADEILNPVIVTMLGVLAFSQLRSREQISSVTKTWRGMRTDFLLFDFPPEYRTAQTAVSHNYFFSGITMNRTLQMMRVHLTRVLRNGGSVRILLPDPRDDSLMEMIARTRSHRSAEQIRNDIENSLRGACELSQSGIGNLEVRVVKFLPAIGINAMDLGHQTKSIMVQMYEFNPADLSEPAPIFFLTAADRSWISHYEAQIHRLWENGIPYPDTRNEDLGSVTAKIQR